ncbi:MAG: WbqC family protein [Paludibacteraceae bacterium]|nr:WbqC family protein [Paludibacteraceae bacterium]
MMTLPVAYLAPVDWYRAYWTNPDEVEIEGLESFEKQTCRNRCLITSAKEQGAAGEAIRLTVPVKKVEHKQLTRDIEISYQTRWQHQHWISLVSAYKHTPYFDYYAEFFRPYYEKEIKYLLDLNCGLHETIVQLLHNSPKHLTGFAYRPTDDWRNAELNKYFGDEKSILDLLFEYGPLTISKL